MSRILLIASYIFAYSYASVALYATDYPVAPETVGERYPGNTTSLSMTLPNVSLANGAHSLTSWEIVTPPSKGLLNASVGRNLVFTPGNYEEGSDSFVWKAVNSTTGNEEQYTLRIGITAVNNPPQLGTIAGNAFTFNENQNVVGTVTIFDPDSLPPSDLRLDVNFTDAIRFDANHTGTSGNYHTFRITYSPSTQPNYEAFGGVPTFTIDLNATDRNATDGSIINQAPLQRVTITLADVEERPSVISQTSVARTILEDQNTNGLFGFQPIEIAASDPESATDPSKKVTWSYTSNNNVLGGAVTLVQGNGASFSLSPGADSSAYNSGELVTLHYLPTANAFGTEVLTLYAKDAVGNVSSSPVSVAMTVTAVNDDSISLNEPSPVAVNFQEEGAGMVLDFNPSDPDSNADPALRSDNNASTTSGAEIYYALSGADAASFQISSTGQLTFKSPPDFESPTDLGGSPGDNIYELTVEVRDAQSAPYTSDSQSVSVTVTSVNELPTLTGGVYTHDILINEDQVWTWSGSPDLNATDIDAGHQATLAWRIKSGANGAFGSALISGTGRFPSAFSYTPNFDYAGDGNANNPDDTFVVEVFDGLASREITFRVFITAQGDPPRLSSITPAPLEIISVSRDRYTVYLDENFPSTVRLQFNEPDGDAIGNFQILNQSPDKSKFAGSPSWTSGATFADLSFSSLLLPNFEVPSDYDGDGNYSLVVSMEDNETVPRSQLIYLDFIIQNIDEPPTFLSTIDFNQSAPENQTQAAALSAQDPEGVTTFFWEIVYGYDSNKFVLSDTNGSSTNLLFTVPPNFEAPLDDATYGDKNNTYVVQVKVSDASSGGKSTTQLFVITVTDENDAPSIGATPLTIDEPMRTNAMLDLSQYASDEDNQSGAGPDNLSWVEISGDTTTFALDLNGTLRFNQDSDYETATNFSIVVRVSDGRGGTHDANFSVEVNEKDEAPDFFESNSSANKITYLQFDLNEDTAISGNLSDYARDPESGNSIGLTFGDNFVDENASNDANGTLVLNTLSGAFTFTPKANYSGLTYVDFSASDGVNPNTLPVVFSVADVPDAPEVREGNNSTIITSLLSKAIIEGNSTFGIELNATDPNDVPASTNFIWSLQGPDGAKFKIEPNPGSYVTLSLLQTPDFENPHDSGVDNRFDLNVTVTDEGNSAYTFPVQVNVINGDEPPYFDYGDGNYSVTYKVAPDFTESGTGIVFDVNASDLDGNSIIFGLTGNGVDDANFSIDPTTGRVTFKTPPDFDIKRWGGAGDDSNTYEFEVNATDDASISDKIRHRVTVTVTNVIEPPSFLNVGSRSIDWNETTTTQVDVNQTRTEDVNQNLLLELSGGTDQALFSLNVATNLLSFIVPPDYENPGSSDGDNLYDLQIRIQGTSITQNLSITVREENDNPVITSTGLTQITINENETFVIDLDVTDQDNGPEYLDILFTKDSNSSKFVAHTGNESSVSALYPSVSSGVVDNGLSGALRSVAGDLDNDGDFDVVSIETPQTIRYMENNGAGFFTRKNPNPLSLNGTGKRLDHVEIADLNQDGNKDIIISYFGDGSSGSARMTWLENNGTGGGAGTFSAEQLIATAPVGVPDIDYFAIGDLDGDSYNDLIVAFRGADSVQWYQNNGFASPSFTLKGQVMTSAQGLDAPRSLELVDIDKSGSLDVVISANQNLYLALNDGRETVFTTSTLTSFTGSGMVAKAVDVTSDGLIDIVYASSMGAPGVILQNPTGFDAPIPLPTHADPLKALAYPTDLAILPATANTRLSVLVSDSSIQYISIFESGSSLNGNFDQPVHVDTGIGVINLSLADLNRQPNALFYSFIGGEDKDDFNETRFRDGGKLYFNSPPDFENPQDATQISRYDVIVKVTDSQGGETFKSVSVSVNEINDAPVITSLDGNLTAVYRHNEGNLTTLFDVTATNDESSTQTLNYSVSGGADQAKFSINSTTGKLTFLQPPDFESNASAAGNNSYYVNLRVTDNGPGTPYDEQNVTIQVEDGFEAPIFNNLTTSHTISEDSSLPAFTISATDQNVGGTITSFGIHTNGSNGTGTVINDPGAPSLTKTATFGYVPDGNFTGTDVVTIQVSSGAGLTLTLPITINVTSINDAPSILTPLNLNHSENLQTVANLSAVDDSNATLIWSWADGTVDDPDFLLDPLGTLSFRLVTGPDYERADHAKSYLRTLRVTDNDGIYTDGNLTITLVNANDNEPYSPYLSKNASTSFTLVENNSTVVDLNVSDLDNLVVSNFNVVTYSLTGGPDRTRFSVNGSGRLSLLPTPDFESPSSADLDNVYQADLTLSDGGYSRTYPIVVTVTDADENAPVITSDGGGSSAIVSLPENSKVATTVQASDVEAQAFTFSITGGADQSLFEINATSGDLNFVSLPNYEKPLGSYGAGLDSKGNISYTNSYEVYVRVTDSYSFAQQQLRINVTDVDEPPTVSPASLSILEDTPIIVTFTVSDPEGQLTDAALLTPPVNGGLSWSTYPLTDLSDVKFIYTPGPNFYGSDSIVLRVTDGVEQGDVTIPIEINATNDPPTAGPDLYVYDNPDGAPLSLNVQANDSNAPDANGTELLTIDTWTKPKYGSLVSRVGGALPDYYPAPGFIGIDTFEYILSDGTILEATGSVKIIIQRATGLPNWRFLENFGYYQLHANNWIYHTDWGWLYVETLSDLATGTWVWHQDVGWFWTGDNYAPNVFVNDLTGWFAFSTQESVGDGLKTYLTWPIYDQVGKKWYTKDEFQVMRINTVISKLTNTVDIIKFVEGSDLFTDKEKYEIVGELIFSGKSAILTAKGFTLAN